ncbi:uncharacterized protein LOC18438368 isoform X2 [Amborella trichopoda]|uniref:uncharacterized protein LOC18438368 isoform X2 n=1 Tax=Amborella trichopoda TaxID=13333 RepID=UPI0005D36706|nr:uncharacterized protein LOC18438368 isoform X2 [Amborella trichopoda]|eukprot:XP_011625021.1 uncharacterized protein LOC18438368 isoform X2 [Amborella trichopoda]
MARIVALSSPSSNWSFQFHGGALMNNRLLKVEHARYSTPFFPNSQEGHLKQCRKRNTRLRVEGSRAYGDNIDSDDSEDDDDGDDDDGQDEQPTQSNVDHVKEDSFREDLEKIVGKDDSTFTGIDLATLIRNKYGRSYDVQLIKKRSFPLTEEEYLMRLDDVANVLKCWGAVSHVRNSLERMKERPRIGKAVSIFIDMDESGGRADEWIYK